MLMKSDSIWMSRITKRRIINYLFEHIVTNGMHVRHRKETLSANHSKRLWAHWRKERRQIPHRPKGRGHQNWCARNGGANQMA